MDDESARALTRGLSPQLSLNLLMIRDEGVRSWRYALRDDGLEGVGPALASYLGGK
jgi:hypothetical protein